MKKIKILIIICHMNNGGAQRIVLNQLEALTKDKRFDVSLLVYNTKTKSYCNRMLTQKKYNVIYLNIFQKVLFKIFNKNLPQIFIKKKLLKIQPNIVHVHMVELMKYITEPVEEANIPIRMVTLHSNPLRTKGKNLNIVKESFAKHDFIPVCLNEQQALLGKKHFNFEKYEILHNGMDYNYIESKIISKEEARKKYGFNQNDYIIGTVGRLEPIKNYELLLHSFYELSKINKNSKLVFAGEGSQYKKLKKLANDLKIANKVTFLGNIDNIVPFYCLLDVFVLTSLSEASPLVLLEAQKCNVHCVISDGVPNESIVTNEVIKVEKKATYKDWANILNNNKLKGEKILNFDDYDKEKTSKKMIEMYISYSKDYIK